MMTEFCCARMILVCDLCASIFLQISFYTYTTAFNIVNGNASYVSIRRLRGYIILCDFFGVFCLFACFNYPSWVKLWYLLNTYF